MSKVKLNQYDEIKRRHAAMEVEKKKFDLKGAVVMNEKPKRTPKPAHDDRFFNVKKYDNWLAPASKEP